MRALLLVALAAAARAQLSYPDVVLTRLTGTPACQLLVVDRILGTVTALPRFPSDALPPSAVAQDPYDRAFYVALDLGAAGSELVRLDHVGPTFVEHGLATLPGRVVDIAVAGLNVYVGVDAPQGGIFRVPRRGGSPVRTVAIDNLTALTSMGTGSVIPTNNSALAAWTGRPGTARTQSGCAIVNLETGATYPAPYTFGNPGGQEVVGVMVVVGAGAWYQVLAFDDGTFARITNSQGPLVPVPFVVPAGGAVAFLPRSSTSSDGLVLGRSSYPFLFDLDGSALHFPAPYTNSPRGC